MTESLSLPKDLMYGDTLIYITGNREILLENFKGLIEYTTEKIRLKITDGQMCIEGTCLFIEYYSYSEIKISGKIERIIYM